jgi:hypothetical protein
MVYINLKKIIKLVIQDEKIYVQRLEVLQKIQLIIHMGVEKVKALGVDTL